MAKAGKSKTMPKMTDKEQSERFKQTARELNADKSAEEFERALDKIIPPKRN
jgi:hypothetical protein